MAAGRTLAACLERGARFARVPGAIVDRTAGPCGLGR